MRHFTESVNTRFEPGIVRLLDKCLENDWCKRRGMNRSDLVRHLVRIGIKNFHQCLENDWCKRRGMNRSDLVRHLVRIGLKNFEDNQPKNRDMIGEFYNE